MRLSLDAATSSAASYAFASFHLGELARTAGDLRAAKRHYDAALGADPTYAPAIAGRARIAAARGNIAGAVRDYREVVSRLPLTEYVVELADLYLATGQPDLAEQQIAVAEASASCRRPTVSAPTWRPRCSRPTTARRPRRSRQPSPSGRSGTPCTPRTRWPGRCTRPAATGRRWATRARRPRSAPGTRGCSSTGARSRRLWT